MGSVLALALLAEIAQDECEARKNGWRDCDHREGSNFMGYGFKCRPCRARDALRESAPDVKLETAGAPCSS